MVIQIRRTVEEAAPKRRFRDFAGPRRPLSIPSCLRPLASLPFLFLFSPPIPPLFLCYSLHEHVCFHLQVSLEVPVRHGSEREYLVRQIIPSLPLPKKFHCSSSAALLSSPGENESPGPAVSQLLSTLAGHLSCQKPRGFEASLFFGTSILYIVSSSCARHFPHLSCFRNHSIHYIYLRAKCSNSCISSVLFIFTSYIFLLEVPLPGCLLYFFLAGPTWWTRSVQWSPV